MVFLRRIRSARLNEHFLDKVADMVTEFCLEAAVLISVLGVLDSAVSLGHTPSLKVLALSLGIGFAFFIVSCIIQASKLPDDAEETGSKLAPPSSKPAYLESATIESGTGERHDVRSD